MPLGDLEIKELGGPTRRQMEGWGQTLEWTGKVTLRQNTQRKETQRCRKENQVAAEEIKNNGVYR